MDVVQVGVSVRQGGRYVADLGAADFAIFEDGRRQELSFFARGERPSALTLMIDASSSMYEKLGAAQAAATRLLRALRPKRHRRGRAVRRPHRGPSGVHVRPGRARRQPWARYAHPDSSDDNSEGSGCAGTRSSSCPTGLDSASVVSEDDLLNLARRVSIVIHAVGLRPKDIPKTERQAWGRAGLLLAALARETGGEAHLPPSLADLEPVYGAVAADLRAQYSLGYVPGPGTRRGEWRRITVVTPGRQSLALRHRTGYYAPSR